jgi:hypothetical protein
MAPDAVSVQRRATHPADAIKKALIYLRSLE